MESGRPLGQLKRRGKSRQNAGVNSDLDTCYFVMDSSGSNRDFYII
jgi:hypothetical protein